MMKEGPYHTIIGGVYKGGTTSLYTYLSVHPEICCSSKKETEYFEINQTDLSEYLDYFKHCQKSKHLLEASPGYLYGGSAVAKRIQSMIDQPKIIFILRDPVERFVSDYRHLIKTMNLPKDASLADFFNSFTEDQKTKQANSLDQGRYIYYLEQWYSVFGDNIRIVFFEDLRDHTMKVMLGLSEWLGIEPSIFEKQQFDVENRSVSYKNKLIHKVAYSVFNRFEAFFRQHYAIKKELRNLYYRFNSESISENFDKKEKSLLIDHYKESNRMLHSFLADKGYRNLPTWVS